MAANDESLPSPWDFSHGFPSPDLPRLPSLVAWADPELLVLVHQLPQTQWFFEICGDVLLIIHRGNGGTLGMVPLIINPIYTMGIYWAYIPFQKGSFGGSTAGVTSQGHHHFPLFISPGFCRLCTIMEYLEPVGNPLDVLRRIPVLALKLRSRPCLCHLLTDIL